MQKTGPGSAVVQSQCFCSRLSVAICFGIVDGRQINQKIKIKIEEEKEQGKRWKMSREREEEIPSQCQRGVDDSGGGGGGGGSFYIWVGR